MKFQQGRLVIKQQYYYDFQDFVLVRFIKVK